MASTADRVGINEAIFREVNERIVEVSAGLERNGSPGLELELVCECSDASCAGAVRATTSDYERVRSNAKHFIVLPTHIWNPEAEREVARTPRFTVIEKVAEAAEIATETDPRK